jgi:protein-L-isoaspartate(D-aspartate) O-methyltransferase
MMAIAAAGRWVKLAALCTVITVSVPHAACAASAEAYAFERRRLVRALEKSALGGPGRLGKTGFAPQVLDAMVRVPRHLFVPQNLRRRAYANRPLPIGYGQTISQPYIVALMTHLLLPEKGQVVFELGTGSGYQAAVLAELGLRVYTMEIIEPLARAAKTRLARLGYRNVTVRSGDGYNGWPMHAPFDAIIVTAAGSHIPPPLIAQLKRGGRMVIPVGPSFMTQQLLLVTKGADGRIKVAQVAPVVFVPLRRAR